jgi:hypothetical protein
VLTLIAALHDTNFLSEEFRNNQTNFKAHAFLGNLEAVDVLMRNSSN